MLHAPLSSPPFRIAYIINSMEGGGASSPVPAILDVLRRCGAEVRVFALTRRDGRGVAALEAAGIAVEVRPGGERDHGRALRWLLRRLRDWRPTHLWTSLTRATLLGQIAGLRLSLPVVSWQHAAFLKPANRRLLRMTRHLTILWVADSDAVAALTADRLKVGPDRLMTWPIFRADAGAPCAAPWRPGEVIRIGSLGRLHPVKGYDVLLRAVAGLQRLGLRFELIVGGEGAERAALEAWAAEKGVRGVHFPGFVADPRAFLAGLHLYVQPSWSEGFCIAAHEAMQAGLPVIASAVGELARSVEPGATGELVMPGAVEPLAGKIAAMIADPRGMAAIGAQARAKVLERFGAEAFEARGRAVMERLVSGGAARTGAASRAVPRSQGRGATASSA
ncbi:glycosyltransferase [Sphingomonas histidinilytica]|uniref:Glycosyltransferase involved in cell wall bisynthesis n=1 Tax=Rhizorhabdus histidinilytica TaxID=439228 RepID=A0A1T5CZ11_9SPHN|nr:glycosyltransferase family 4 protein [Rhizorhabdus histidinilytica]MBO9376338.1 glycosyltransferase [Rhizorhabdus histidinilytica]SKB64629.1 Glycosyltransferase involved in cell wall bisynthesis [Rhizorhabdus histidinilytica]